MNSVAIPRGMVAAGCLAFISLTFADVQARDAITPADRPVVADIPVRAASQPWQTLLRIKGREGYVYCGGAVIAPHWIVTGASCVRSGLQPRNVDVRIAGSKAEFDWHSVRKIIIHERYDGKSFHFDIALLQLVSEVPGGSILDIQGAEHLKIGQGLEVSRWARTSETGEPSAHLLMARVPFVSNAVCNERDNYNGAVTQDMLCAGNGGMGLDACQGEIGGPLTWQSPDMRPILVGIVAWSAGCARKLGVGVYTRISSYAEWIAQTITRNP